MKQELLINFFFYVFSFIDCIVQQEIINEKKGVTRKKRSEIWGKNKTNVISSGKIKKADLFNLILIIITVKITCLWSIRYVTKVLPLKLKEPFLENKSKFLKEFENLGKK